MGAHRVNGKRFIVRADEKLDAFVELELAIRTGERQDSTRKRRLSTEMLRRPY